MSIKKVKHGGKRTNSGRKSMYNESTSILTHRVPTSKKQEIKKLINNYLTKFKVKKWKKKTA